LAPEDDGGLSIIGYHVITDEADYIYGAPDPNLLSLSYTKTIAPGNEGKIYRFKIAAENSLGIGEYSDEI
jgi:hypothetical protein